MFLCFSPTHALDRILSNLYGYKRKNKASLSALKICSGLYPDKIFGKAFTLLGTVNSGAHPLISPETVLKDILSIFFHQSSQLLEASKYLILMFLVNSLTSVFKIDVDTSAFLLRKARTHLRMIFSKLVYAPFLSLWHFKLLLWFFRASNILFLLLSRGFPL